MSGGGRCNFTNLDTAPGHFYSENPYFCISALKRYRPEHFVSLVETHGVEYVEKSPWAADFVPTPPKRSFAYC